MIKFLDLYKQYRTIQPEIDAVIKRTIEESSYIGGKENQIFEESFAKFQNTNYCIGVANGTDALEISIEALGLKPNSEIIVPANSFISTSEAVTRLGHKVVFCDIDEETLNIDINNIEENINENTGAIIVVHLYGNPVDMNKILQLAEVYKIRVIEDCAQAHGAEYFQKRVGSFGDMGCFSFYPGKNLGAYGDGGAITTNDEKLAEKVRMIANHGRLEKYNHEFEGRNSRLDGLQAAILNVKLNYLNNWTDRRNEIARIYSDGLSIIENITTPFINNNSRHAFHLYVIRLDKRDELQNFLKDNNISTGIHYPIALPDLPAYEYLNQKNKFKASIISKQILSLPMGEHLADKDISYVISKIKLFFN